MYNNVYVKFFEFIYFEITIGFWNYIYDYLCNSFED